MIWHKNYNLIFLVILALVGVSAILFSTNLGIGTTADSSFYIITAKSFLSGQGLSTLSCYDANGNLIKAGRPTAWCAPLLSMIFVVFGFLGMELLNAIRWLNVLLFGANIFLAGFIIYRFTRSIWASILGSFLVLTSLDMLWIHSSALTEPLFIFFGFLGLFLLAAYISKPKPYLLIFSACAIALAFLDRYAGITLIITGVIGLFSFNEERLRKKAIDSFVFLIISLFPIMCWFIRNLYFTGGIIGRPIVFHPIEFKQIISALKVCSLWVSPDMLPSVIKYVFFSITTLIFLILVIILVSKRKKQNYETQRPFVLILIFSLFIIIYCVSLIFSISFIDALADFRRYLLPVHISLLVILPCLLYILWKSFKKKYVLKCIFFLYVIFSPFFIKCDLVWLINAHRNGLGFTNKIWSESQIIKKVAAFPPGTLIYTNGADTAIYFLTGKNAFNLPEKIDLTTDRSNINYKSELELMRGRLKNKSGIIVYFEKIKGREFPSENELKNDLPLCLLTKMSDGSIYKLKE